MPGCSICGRQVPYSDIVYTGGMELCRSCEASGAFSTDAPCSRCGVYIPRTELQMFRSRLYCNYCIMDMRFEEKERTDRETRANREGPKAPSPSASGGDSGAAGGAMGIVLGEQVREKACDICGRTSDIIYYFGTVRVCPICKGGLDPDFDKVAKKGFGSNIPIVGNFVNKRKFRLKKGIGKRELAQIIIKNLGAQRARLKAAPGQKESAAKGRDEKAKKPANIGDWQGLEVEDIDGVEVQETLKQEAGKKRGAKERKGVAMPALGMSEAIAISRLEKRLSRLAGYDEKGYSSLRARLEKKHAGKIKPAKRHGEKAGRKNIAHSKKGRKK
ncbi:MAG: hypothetical protein WC506_05520 [Candidatus Micrarchaeia archaeon]